ncbi:2'-5' RNA ligase family protein [Candidatus Peregrinibacteria bacterium]|nr:2'-5' RNA ligase family protein [Candidatus Peregrinibacteria bacterium]
MTALSFPLRSVFLGLPLEGDAKKQFRMLQDALKPFENILRFQSPETPHLTLQFWPTLMEIEYGQIEKQIPLIAEKHESFSLKIEGVEFFGKHGDDHVMHLSVPFSEPLARLRKSCPWPLDRPFHPHITLARIDHPQRFVREKKKVLKALGSVSFEMPVNLLRLYGNVAGKSQTPIADFPLDAAAMSH